MAVIDTLEDRLHEHSAIALTKLSTIEDFVKELPAFAYFCDEIVPFFIFKKLVHCDYVWVVDILENIDFVEKHALLVVVHVALS